MKNANALSVMDKITVRRLRRTAREELRALKKAGAVVVDADATERLLKDNKWILEQGSDIRKAIRQRATIRLSKDVVVNYAELKEAQANWRKYNLSVETWNALHSKEIQAGTMQARKTKKWTLASTARETQETANAYLSRMKRYENPKAYFESLRQMYIDNAMKAIESSTQNLPNGGSLVNDFVRSMLEKHTPQHGAKHVDIEFMYEPKHVLNNIDRLAIEYGFVQEWVDFQQEHKDYFSLI